MSPPSRPILNLLQDSSGECREVNKMTAKENPAAGNGRAVTTTLKQTQTDNIQAALRPQVHYFCAPPRLSTPDTSVFKRDRSGRALQLCLIDKEGIGMSYQSVVAMLPTLTEDELAEVIARCE